MFRQRTLIKEQGGDMQAYVSPLIFFFISRIFFLAVFLTNKPLIIYRQMGGKKLLEKNCISYIKIQKGIQIYNEHILLI